MTARIVVAAPASGHGKTTVATGLLAAFAARGMAVSGHKVGPDYIDPGYHALASGRPGRNLDPFMVGADRIAPLFAHGAVGTDVAVVEGVMGLYDGVTGQGDLGSTAQVAQLLRAPVLLVVDASAQGRSVAALVHGFRSWQPSVWLGGVVLNRVGSDRHETILREALDDLGVPVLGVLRRHDAAATPSRHLGLVPAAERSAEARATVAELAGVVADGLDLDAILALARSAPELGVAPWSAADEVGEPVSGRPVVAVAGGPAFTFAYAEHAELLAAAGAEVAIVDPLRDSRLPDGTRALVVGGGFPEVHAEGLSANEPLRAAVRDLANSGAPVAAECAGLLWLARSLDGLPMCGVLDAVAEMTPRLTLGYRQAVAVSASVLAAEGQRVNGHEFHRTTVTPRAGDRPAWQWQGGAAEGFVAAGLHASYLHLHWAGLPSIAQRLVRTAVRVTA
ncbi:MAG: cobyrinic acid a,c-diamide synthase [Cryptosporangiaceae bacterium]|nr:cobyrinic acid a,c-diamide synthase [Cryptosporangiaceae bacterium]